MADSGREEAARRQPAPEATTHPFLPRSAQVTLLVVTLTGASVASAHRLDPGLLVVDATGSPVRGTWTPPAAAPQVRPLLPDGCEPRTPAPGSRVIRADCPIPLQGELGRTGPGAMDAEVLVRIDRGSGPETTTLTAAEPVLRLSAAPGIPSRGTAFLHALRQGLPHVLGGADHVLFVLGLVLLLRNPRRLVGAVTAFTAGHSLTLALASLGALHLPARPVEACIALSVLLLAVELRLDRDTLARRRPWLLAGLFGLVHGLGFAGALDEAGLPPDRALETLLGFNLGVEAAQLIIVVAALPIAAWTRSGADWRRQVPCVLLGATGLAWTLDRILVMLPW